MEQRTTRIIAETDRHRVSGMLRLPPDGYRSRLSDYLNSPDRQFLPLTEVDVESLDGNGQPEHYSFLALSLRHVVIAMPADESE